MDSLSPLPEMADLGICAAMPFEGEKMIISYIMLRDTCITSIRRDGIAFRDGEGGLRFIDFAACARIFAAEYPGSSGRCVGLRQVSESSFVFYTGEEKVKLVFHAGYVFRVGKRRLLTGRREKRMEALQGMIVAAGYTTFDRS